MPSRPSPHDLLVGTRLLWNLPSYLRRPVSTREARSTLHTRFERRDAAFLTLAREHIYGCSWSPYRQLLGLAGCEYGDLEWLVRTSGLEGALHSLFRNGVYLTVDEYKGRRPTVRGSATFAFTADQLRNPRASVHVQSQTSGSRGSRTAVGFDLASLREVAVNLRLWLDARGAERWVHAGWMVPGGSAMIWILRMCGTGARPVRWFSQLDPASSDLHARYTWGAELLYWGGRIAGRAVPRPECALLDDPVPAVRWVTGSLHAGRIPHIHTYPSAAVKLCQAAARAGIDIQGAQFTAGGEPVTAARLASVRSAGAELMPLYTAVETDQSAYGCLAPDAPDDVHLLSDLHALIQPGPDGGTAGLPADALLLTSLRPTAPLVLLNVSLGDQATVVSRDCGCPLSQLGWKTHLHTIRSHEKLTAGGMTFLDRDVVRVLEEVLPGRFGGAPTDYQLVEDEAEDGYPRLRLLIHPSVGSLDPAAVAHAFLSAIGPGSGTEHLMGKLWREAGFLHVERTPPRITASGKILHLHASSQRRSPG